MKKILVIFLAGLGNAILLEPTLRALRRGYLIDFYIKQKVVEDLYRDSGLINNFIYYKKFLFKKYDAIISTSAKLGIKEKIFISLIRAKEKITYEKVSYSEDIQEKDCHLRLAGALGRGVKDKHPRIYFKKNKKIKLKKPAIGFHPGCSQALKYKRWPIKRFARVADNFKNNNIYIFGGPEEKNLAENMQSLMKARSVSLAGQLNILETAQAIGQCDLFISNDSGLMHIASAMKVPVVAIFGSTNIVKNAPLSRHEILKKSNSVKSVLAKEVINAGKGLL